ncbi:OmpP1/FadL family transporter [Labrys okinawensis]|uniref:OmpP1/FadL family transporter n=1 Tax=Labrys okinawensis TaxID=346911 RepID=UPI0039BD1842
MASKKHTAVVFVAASLAASSSSTALAGGFGNRLQSTIGAGLSFAGSGTDTYGLSGIYWNPAAINTATSFDWSSNYSFTAPYGQMRATNFGPLQGSVNSGDVGIDAIVPGTYGAYRINPDWVVGVAVTAPFGLSTKPDRPWKGSAIAVTSKALLINTDLLVGYRVNDWLSIAAGPSIVYATARFSRDVAGVLPGYQGGTLKDLDDWGVGFTAGATIKPWQGGEIALGYRSPISLTLGGTLVSALAPVPTLPVEGKITLPDMVTLGFSQELTPQWTALASVEWKNWSRVQTVPFRVTSGPLAGAVPTTLAFHYRDGWNMAIGAEYRWDEALTLRGGVGYEISPVDDSNRSTSIPDGNRIWLSGGASYAFNERLSVDFAYSHGFVQASKVNQIANSGIGPVPFSAKVKARIEVVSLGFRYKFGSDAVQKMPEAVVKP